MSEDTDQFSRMINLSKKKNNNKKNMMILPQLSPHHHHDHHQQQLYYNNHYNSYGYGNILFPEVSMLQTDNILNANEISSFYMDSNQLYNQQYQQLEEALPFCPQLCINNLHQYQYPAASAVPSMENVDQQCFHSQTLLSSYGYDMINTIHNQQEKRADFLNNNYCSTRKHGRRRTLKVKTSENEWKSNKKRAAGVVACYRQEQSQEYQFLKNINEAPAVTKRSQKFADKITALQKLVSPYGKTDTASILYEASIFIKVVQDQIKNIFNTLPPADSSKSTPQKNTAAGEGEGEGKELSMEVRNRSKSLGLVPIWLAQKFVEEEGAMEEEEEEEEEGFFQQQQHSSPNLLYFS